MQLNHSSQLPTAKYGVFLKLGTHSSNKLSIKVENKPRRGCAAGARGGGPAPDWLARRLHAVHPAQVLVPPAPDVTATQSQRMTHDLLPTRTLGETHSAYASRAPHPFTSTCSRCTRWSSVASSLFVFFASVLVSKPCHIHIYIHTYRQRIKHIRQ